MTSSGWNFPVPPLGGLRVRSHKSLRQAGREQVSVPMCKPPNILVPPMSWGHWVGG